MNASKTLIHQMAIDAWGAGTGLLVVCLALEAAERGFVSRFFNLLWLLLFTIIATILVMATHPGPTSGHRYAKGVKSLLQLGSLALAAAAWLLLPESLSVVWRSVAVIGIVLAALLSWPALSKNE